MKRLRKFPPVQLVLFLLLPLNLITNAQEWNITDYPLVTNDLLETEPYIIESKLKFDLPGVLGVGLSGTYFIKNVFTVTTEAGLGWTLKTKEPDINFSAQGQNTEGNYRYLMPWLDFRAGYPITLIRKKSRKFYSEIGDRSIKYYRIEVPVYIQIIPEVGFFMNPVNIKKKTFLANVFTAGLNFRTLVKSDVSFRDKKSGNKLNGTIRSNYEFRAGIVIPLKESIYSPANNTNYYPKADGPGFYVNLAIQYRTAAFNVGIRSLGYKNSKGPMAQFQFGGTFYLK